MELPMRKRLQEDQLPSSALVEPRVRLPESVLSVEIGTIL